MQPSLSERIVASYLLCKTKASLQLAGEIGVKSEYEALLEKERDRVRIKFLNQHGPDSILNGVAINRKVLKAGAAAIINAVFEDEGTYYHCDLLVRRQGASALGDFHYVPAIVHGGYSNTLNARQILSLTGSKLAPLQRLAPKHGLVINASFERVPRTIALPSKPSEVKKILLGIEALRSEPARLQLNSHCTICEYRSRCAEIAKKEDDLSLLKGLAPKAIRKLRGRGIFTVFQYAHTFRARRKHSGTAGAPRQHALQAMAIRDQKLYVIGTPELPTGSTSVYLDFEGDPERGLVYLIGALVCRDGTSQQHSFWADDSRDEPIILDKLYQLLASLGSFDVYCYGSYESACLKRWANSEQNKVLCDLISPGLTNVLNLIYKHLYLPTYSNGLKDIASSLGFRWRMPNATGALSVLWRRKWEQCRTSELKQRLIEYNADDCTALSMVTNAVYSISRSDSRMPWPQENIEKQSPTFARPTWETAKFQISDFEFINKRAYFDYQRDRVYIRSGNQRRSTKPSRRPRKHRHELRPTHRVTFEGENCPSCGSKRFDQTIDGRVTKIQYDLKKTPSGLKRIVRHTFAMRCCCQKCNARFLPHRHERLKRFGHALHCWVAYHNVEHRVSFASIASILRDTVGVPMQTAIAFNAKCDLARVYEPLYRDSLNRIIRGPVIHADETEIALRSGEKAYVWALTSMYDAVYIFRESRETTFLHKLLTGFQGVLITDFYVGYDSLNCPQQRCLIHLMRDFNQSLRLASFDEELRGLAQAFGQLLKSIVLAIDVVGLKSSKLRRFKKPVAQFLSRLDSTVYTSNVAEDYRLRLLKNRNRLFTFLDYDNVPWNNNNAEHAMKHVAWYREAAENYCTPKSIQTHLVLLGIHLTCRYRDLSFLKFLLSRKLSFDPNTPKGDDDWFDLHPPGYQNPRGKPKSPTPNPPSSSPPTAES